MNLKTALTIAGSDCSGGAGIQADLKTMIMNGVYGMSAVTALTAQNTTGVRAIQEVTPDFLEKQLDAIFEDIYPDAVKIGMVSSGELIRVIADRLRYYHANNVVVDPVMVATSGSALIKNDAVQTLIKELLPIAVVTPNIPEAEVSPVWLLKQKRICSLLQRRLEMPIIVQFCLKAVTVSTMPMICFMKMADFSGLRENGSIIQIHMVPAVHFPAPLPLILRKDLLLRKLFGEQKTIFLRRLPRCLIWGKVPGL